MREQQRCTVHRRLLALFLSIAVLLSNMGGLTVMAAESGGETPVNVYVSATGSDTEGDGTQENPYASVGKAYSHIYGEVGTSGTVNTNTIYLIGTVKVSGITPSDRAKVSATIKGVDENSVLQLGGAWRLFGDLTLSNLKLNGKNTYWIYAGGFNFTVENTVTYKEGYTNLSGGLYANYCTSTNVKLYGGYFGTVYAGTDKNNVTKGSNVLIGGNARVTNLYGGSNHTATSSATPTATVTIEGGTVTNLYLGGRSATGTNHGKSEVTANITGGSVTTMYAGGRVEGTGTATIQSAKVNISGGTIETLYIGQQKAD